MKLRNPLQQNVNSNMSLSRIRSTSPRPNPLKFLHNNLDRSQLSRNQSEFDSMLSNIRPSRSNSTRSLKYKSDYDPAKLPRKPCLRTSLKTKGINIGFTSDWDQFNKSNDSLRGNSFTIKGKSFLKKNRFMLKMEPMSNNRDSKQSQTKIEKKNVSFTENPKIIYVENWKILNVDMSKEGKLYNRFNRGSKGMGADDKCKIF